MCWRCHHLWWSHTNCLLHTNTHSFILLQSDCRSAYTTVMMVQYMNVSPCHHILFFLCMIFLALVGGQQKQMTGEQAHHHHYCCRSACPAYCCSESFLPAAQIPFISLDSVINCIDSKDTHININIFTFLQGFNLILDIYLQNEFDIYSSINYLTTIHQKQPW